MFPPEPPEPPPEPREPRIDDVEQKQFRIHYLSRDQLRVLWQPIVQIEDHMVVRAAYRVLRKHADAAAAGNDATQRRLWKDFPKFEEAAITKESRADVRDTLQKFLVTLRK